MAGYWFFATALVLIGVTALTVTNTTNSLMRLSTTPTMRGRVMALRVGAASGFAAAMVAIFVLTRGRQRPQS